MDTRRLENQVAVVTGAGGGIGRAVSLLLAAEGAAVVVNDLGCSLIGKEFSSSPADSIVREIEKLGGKAVANYDSVATMEGGQGIMKTAIEHFGRIDIVVNAAGILRSASIFKMTEEDWDFSINTHLKGHFTCIRHAVEVMREQRYGRIVNVSSEGGIVSAFDANYAAAKEGIIGLTRVVARDVGRYGITCNAIRPRAITRMGPFEHFAGVKKTLSRVGLEVPNWVTETMDHADLCTPENIAPFIVYLASPDAADINGQDFIVWGRTIIRLSEPLEWRSIHKVDTQWAIAELVELVPRTLMKGVLNPAPRQPSK